MQPHEKGSPNAATAPSGLYSNADLGDAIADETIAMIRVGEQSEPGRPADDPQGVTGSDRDVSGAAPALDVNAEVWRCQSIRDSGAVVSTPIRRLVQRVAERLHLFWAETLTTLGRYLGAGDLTVTTRIVCVDSSRQWRHAGNVWHNSMVRSVLQTLAAPVTALRRRRS